ncbi:MAG: AraC family transcriptional regulator [Acidobacteriaceae bacterium]|nr:AraC family transcriptional regulator [Acidobacteriaceae bacterium]
MRAVLPASVLAEVAERIYGKGFVRQVTLPSALSLADRGLLSLLRSLRRALRESPDSASAKFLCRAVAAHVLQRKIADVEFVQPLASVAVGLTARHAFLLYEYIEAHLSRAITIEELARYLNMSRMTFLRRFKATTGVTVQRVITEIRVDRAKALLAYRDLSIAEIAAQCGFVSASHLGTVTRPFLKVTPLAYRAKILSREIMPDVSLHGTERLLQPARRQIQLYASIDGVGQQAVKHGHVPASPEFQLDQTSLTVNDRVRIMASSEGRGWTDLFAAVTDESPHAAIFGAVPAVWLAMAFSPLELQRTSSAGIHTHALPEYAISTTGAGDAAHDEIPTPVQALHIYLRQPVIDKVREELFDAGGPRDIQTVFGFTDPVLQRMMASVRRALGEPTSGNQLKMDYLSHALAAHLLANYSSRHSRRATFRAVPLNSREIRLIADYIAEHLAFNMRIAELSGVVGMARSQFIARFQATTNLTPHQFVILRRIARARQLLVDPRFNHADVSATCGFSSEKHFAATFRRVTGMTPRIYRRLAVS